MIWVMRDARLILTMAHLLSSLLHQSWQDCNEDRLEFCFHVTTPISHEALQVRGGPCDVTYLNYLRINKIKFIYIGNLLDELCLVKNLFSQDGENFFFEDVDSET